MAATRNDQYAECDQGVTIESLIDLSQVGASRRIADRLTFRNDLPDECQMPFTVRSGQLEFLARAFARHLVRKWP